MKTFPTTPVQFELAGKTRQLRYSLGAVKAIKEKYGKDFQEIMKHPPETMLPDVLLMGAVDKEGLTLEVIEQDLTGPDIERAQMAFIEAFFGQRLAAALKAMLEKQNQIIEQAMTEKAAATVQ